MRITHDLARRILRSGAVLMFLMAILGAVGEYLGWWNLVGEILMMVGTVGGIVLSGADLLRGASEEQVVTVQSQLGSVDAKLDTLDVMDSKLDTLDVMDSKLETMDTKLDKLDDLDVIKQALIAEDGATSKLDVVQVELDRQTGVLDRQLDVLTEIRDRI